MKFPKDQIGEEELFNEYEILSAIKHPNLMRTIEYKQEGGTPYLVLEYTNTIFLSDYLQALDQSQIINNEMWSRYYFKQIMEGLKALRDINIAHLDVNIDNIFVSICSYEEEKATDKAIIQVKIGNFGNS